jgi:GMP synthase-like glutamine amidotransferase
MRPAPAFDRFTSQKGEEGLLLIIENDPEVPLGILGSLLSQEALSARVLRVHGGESCDSMASVAGLVVLGGAMSTSETERFSFLTKVKRLMQDALDSGLPVLGICLGGQLLAEVAGGQVRYLTDGEKGLHDIILSGEARRDPLFSGLPERFPVFQWHSDSILAPESSVLLAGSPRCPHQAFRIGPNAYGIQFHPEVDGSIVASWAAPDPGAAEIEETFARHRLAGQDAASVQILRNFLRITRRC